MSEKELKAAVVEFVDRLIDQRDRHANFDFFLFFDVDSPVQDFTGVDVMYVNTFTSIDGFNLGMVMLNSAMRDSVSRDFAGHPDNVDVNNNSGLRILGFDGYLVN